MKGLAINTENQMQFKDFGEPLLDNLQKEVGGCIEVVHPKYLPEGLCMVIDDEGLLKGYAISKLMMSAMRIFCVLRFCASMTN